MPDRAARLATALAGRYQIEREIGSGGMATVYLAQDLKLSRRVALKVLRPELAAVIGPARFLAEIRTTANLQHPHILPLHDSGEVDGSAFYVMPFVEGESLRDRLRREGQLPLDEAIRITTEIAAALDYAHRSGVIHRDIKPENILLQQGTSTLADFGIALAVNQAGGERLTETGLSLGTPHYMSPEQATGDRTVDARSDIYALGAVLYEMLTGEPPHPGATAQAVVAKLLTERPTAVRTIRDTVPAGVEAAVMKALARSPVDRYQHAGDFAAALAAPEDLRVKASPLDPRKSAIAIGAIVLAVASGVLYLSFGRSEPIPRIGRSEQLTTEAGLEIQPSLSPDGRLVAYAAGNSARMRVFIRPVGGGRTIPLSDDSTAVETEPKWSPDGTRLLFLSRGAVNIAPALGGSSRVIIPRTSTDDIAAAVWSPDGEEIAFVRGKDSLLILAADGSSRFVGSGPILHSCTWSGDGRWIACVSQNRISMRPGATFGNLAPTRILLFPSRGGEPVVLAEAAVNHSPMFAGTSPLLLYISNRDGPRDVYAVRLTRSGRVRGQPQRITTGLGANAISISSDGRRITYAVYTARANIWSVPIVPGVVGTDQSTTQVTSGSQVIENLQLSPDGKWLVYDSDLKGNADIYRIPVEGGVPEQLTDKPVDEFAPELSADGGSVLYHSWRSGTRDIEIKHLESGEIEQVTALPDQESYPQWVPGDSAIVYYDQRSGDTFRTTRNGAGGWTTPELLVRRAQRGDVSADGRLLVFTAATVPNLPGPIRVVSLSGGEPRSLTPPGLPELESGAPIWSLDGRTVYCKVHDEAGQTSFWAIPATGGRPRLVARLTNPVRQSARFDMTTDGRRLFFPIEDRQSDIFVAELIKER